jgi:LPS export ABC transporter protein LptC
MRKRARRLVVALIVLLLASGGWLLGRQMWEQRRDDLAQQALDLLPQVAQRIRDFHRVKVDDGRKVWEVAAREAQYYQEEELVVVKQPLVSFHMKDGRMISLRGEEGKVMLGERDLRQVEVSGGIEVTLGDYALRADFARYERDPDRIVAPGAVQIRGADFALSGQGMRVDVKEQRLTLDRQVRMTLWPDARGGEAW